MAPLRNIVTLITVVSVSFTVFITTAFGCSNGHCKLRDQCLSDGDCSEGLYCLSCSLTFEDSRCVRSTATDQFKLLERNPEPEYLDSLSRTRKTLTDQLNNGVRSLMLDTYDFEGDIWLCHSFKGKCHDYTAFEPAIDTLKEIEAFLTSNPSEIITLILEDYVESPNGLTKVFTDSGLMKYWFPVSRMPKNGRDWPVVKDMVSKNQRLVVFTSIPSKEQTEGIAYQWKYMVENQYGNIGVKGACINRRESSPLNDRTKSLVLVNHFGTVPVKEMACAENSGPLIDTLNACHAASGNRWANFVAVDYYKKSDGGGAFQAVDMLNGKLLCNSNDVHRCLRRIRAQ